MVLSSSHSFKLPYGHSYLNLLIPENHKFDLIAPHHIQPSPDPLNSVLHALENPLENLSLKSIPGKTAAIAINDKTRPVPHDYLLPPVLDSLDANGLKPHDIQIIIATGTHHPQPPSEFKLVLPEKIVQKYPVISHDSDDRENLAYLGDTLRGTPVWVNRRFREADIRIVIGNIEPHQFMGFSGGVKTAAIGLAGRETINFNHAMMRADMAVLGKFHQNPARQDVEEIGAKIGVHFALNAVLNADKQIVSVLAGSPQAVIENGIPIARQICQVPVDHLYDLVIASPGGHPKDINIYQSQKGLAHAALLTRPGGILLLAAACLDGSGSQSYEQWMAGMTSHTEVIERFTREGFRVGPHKAFQIARDAVKCQLSWYSELEYSFAQQMLLNPIADFQAEINRCLNNLSPNARIALLPRASVTIPDLEIEPD